MNHVKTSVAILAIWLCWTSNRAQAQCTNPTQGPDVIVGDLIDIGEYGKVGNISAFAIGTTSCNIGNVNVKWIASTNEHPVIGQNLYRLKAGRFEHIGQSWLKHGFTALTQNLCCSCNGVGGSQLGIGCSDPYGSGLNGSQGNLGPRSEVNAATGLYPYPYVLGSNPQTGNAIYKRLQVRDADLEPTLNSGALYFGEGQYVTRDDATLSNKNNNASYRRASVTATGTYPNATYALDWASGATTQRQKPAIQAWQDNDPTVQIVNVDVPNDGRFIVAWKVTNPSPGVYHYEYAIQNLTSDRSGQGFIVPITGAVISNIGFHDVDYHSGEPYSLTDWAATQAGGNLTWQTETFATNPNANALRWGTLYNFRFDATTGPLPSNVNATIQLFKNGTPTSMTVAVAAPAPADCNNNGTLDNIDISNGTSLDCNSNFVPDECEMTTNDCNSNGLPDDCELAGNDCDNNGQHDSCQLASQDCNNDGTVDACQMAGNDCDANGQHDSCQLGTNDTDQNGVPDNCQPDCDHDGQIDAYEIILGAEDCNANGVPDICDTNAPSTAGNVNLAIPDNTPAGINSTVIYPGAGLVTDVNLTVHIPHTAVSNLKITLSHGGTSVVVWNNRCGSFDNLHVTFDDAGAFINCANLAGTYRPNSTGGTVLSAFNNIPAAGDWTLNVADIVAGDSGTFQSWVLDVTSTIPPTPPAPDVNDNDIPDSCECLNCKGDGNHDGKLDGLDIGMMAEGLVGGGMDHCLDMDNSGTMTQSDVSMFVTAITASSPPCAP